MIQEFRHNGLKRHCDHDDRSKIAADLADRIRVIPAALDEAGRLDDLDRPSFRLHASKAT